MGPGRLMLVLLWHGVQNFKVDLLLGSSQGSGIETGYLETLRVETPGTQPGGLNCRALSAKGPPVIFSVFGSLHPAPSLGREVHQHPPNCPQRYLKHPPIETNKLLNRACFANHRPIPPTSLG